MASDRCFVELSPATSGMPFLVIPGAPQYARERVVAQIVRDVCTESELAMPVRWTLGEQRLRQDRESQVRPVQGTRTAFDADAPTCSQLRVAASSVSAAISHCYGPAANVRGHIAPRASRVRDRLGSCLRRSTGAASSVNRALCPCQRLPAYLSKSMK